MRTILRPMFRFLAAIVRRLDHRPPPPCIAKLPPLRMDRLGVHFDLAAERTNSHNPHQSV